MSYEREEINKHTTVRYFVCSRRIVVHYKGVYYGENLNRKTVKNLDDMKAALPGVLRAAKKNQKANPDNVIDISKIESDFETPLAGHAATAIIKRVEKRRKEREAKNAKNSKT